MYNSNVLLAEIGSLNYNSQMEVLSPQMKNIFYRMECLEMVQNRQADFLAADPEDMYIAFNLKNEDFSIFSELRTVSNWIHLQV